MWFIYSCYLIAMTFARAIIALIVTLVIAGIALYGLSEAFDAAF